MAIQLLGLYDSLTLPWLAAQDTVLGLDAGKSDPAIDFCAWRAKLGGMYSFHDFVTSLLHCFIALLSRSTASADSVHSIIPQLPIFPVLSQQCHQKGSLQHLPQGREPQRRAKRLPLLVISTILVVGFKPPLQLKVCHY